MRWPHLGTGPPRCSVSLAPESGSRSTGRRVACGLSGPLRESRSRGPRGLSASAPPRDVARAFLGRHAAAFGIRDQARDLRVSASESGTAGRSAVRFQQLNEDVPVLGGELVVNLDADRNVLSASGEALPAADVATSPRVGSGTARDAAVAAVAKDRGVAGLRLDADIPNLSIYDAGILGGPGPNRPVLVWRVEVKGEDGLAINELALVDAELGVVALRIDQIHNAKTRSVCDASNTPAQYPCTGPVATEADPPAPPDHADVGAAFEFAGDTYDFFAGFGRDSLDDQGLPLRSTVRYCPNPAECPYANAFWDGQQMVYGQGFSRADDVVGHELTHGVTDFSAHLFYYYQSGAINESLSDVFGEFVDLTNGTGTDTATTRWKLGEDIPGIGAIRDMEEPGLFGDPDKMTSSNYTADANEQDAGGVHQNSGVNNKAAFLMTDGGSFNGRTVTGLGIDRTSRIYYEVQTKLLTSAGDYADLSSALPQACANLIGSAGITASNCSEVADAVAAVEMGTVPPAAPNPEAPVCASSLVPTDLFSDDLENSSSGNWTAQTGWYYPQTANPFGYDATYATSGTKNLWGDDRETRGDTSIAMTRSVAIPSGSAAHLRFNHAYGFDDDANGAYDGGVLEVSTNNGASYTDAGPLLTDNGYDGPMTAGFSNPALNSPLAGRQAFLRESNGYKSTRATLSSLGGQSVRFRFRIGTDSSVGDYGWFVDDIRIYTCAPPPPQDGDGDGVVDASDACPSVAASTADGCPAAVANPPATGGGTAGGGATTGGSDTTSGGVIQPATLRDVRVSPCRLSGRGRRARLRCRLSSFRAVTRASVKVTRRGRTVASGSARPSANGTLAIRPRRTLRRGSYRVTIKLRDASGTVRTVTASLKVR